MATASMDIHRSKIVLDGVTVRYFVAMVLCGLSSARHAFAFDWQLLPNLSMSEVFSDNLTLSNAEKQSGFVSEVSPGISVFGSSPWSSFNLNYRLQGLYNAGGRDQVDINHQLQMNGLYQAVRDTLFLQTRSSISQQNIRNTFLTTDNLSGNDGYRVESKNFSISPYWTPHFGQYASGLLRVGYEKSSFDNTGLVSGNNSLAITDSETFSRQAGLSSGSKFNIVRWNLNYSSQDQNRVDGNDVRFEQYGGDARYYFNRKYNVFVRAGYENNDYRTASNSINNGFYYTFGGQWSPSQFYSLEAGYGNNKIVTVRVNPAANFNAFVTYENRDVGLNTGNVWNAHLNYILNHGSVNFSYSQETTTAQQVLAQQQIFTDPFGNAVSNTTNQTLLAFNPNLPDLSLGNDVIISKQANLSFNFQTGKSFYNLSLYNTQRSYEPSRAQDDVYGASGSWNWQFQPRLDFYFRPSWQSMDGSGASRANSKRYDVALGLTRGFPINLGRPLLMNTSLEFRHINQQFDNPIVNGSIGNDYTENRATANFAVRF
ncbi:TIGR03016 family PEP-CTERM system-associated outer membrane protein [Methylomonas sp. SURF-2]|uniref:TIGR03016 family PEP-CTERM system-associated outer membrane protein n=1 Tax=Methylomonas subterranea TaxID=2952225 RepID=A0ABT1TAY2_9GAMM|nr:TIGR03016 family PEP-CTERM system-associated outer membrane protein [Methylomonas sp. SURF-2]MCQ8102626.1 TIGR03016 family PEP-CTERM system-associated outer membrane protein [Methylomonas sp. SURF-2]